MPALDTNVLVRYVVQDDETQLAAARRLIRKSVGEGQTLFVPITVALELEWVLRSSFEYSRDDATEILSTLRCTDDRPLADVPVRAIDGVEAHGIEGSRVMKLRAVSLVSNG
jgi:predicted nucleic-acid-binding protein